MDNLEYTDITIFGRTFEYMEFRQDEITHFKDLITQYRNGRSCYIFITPVEALADYISAKFLFFEFFGRKEVEFLVEGDRLQRVSVRVDVLVKCINLLRSGKPRDIEIALLALETVTDQEVREQVRKEKRELYFKYVQETEPVAKAKAYEEYRKYTRECLI